MLSIIESKHEGTKVVVTIEGRTFQEVATTEAKNLAIKEATTKIGLCGIGGSTGPYVVDDDGKEVSDGMKLASMIKEKKGYSYRNDFTVNQSLGL